MNRRNKEYLPGLEVFIKVTNQDQKKTVKHFRSLIVHLIEHGTEASQLKIKKRRQIWKSGLEGNNQQKTDHTLEKVEKSLKK